jgi:predicted Zn-dependent peptidase
LDKQVKRQTVDEAKVIVACNPTVRKLQEKIEEIWEDLPDHTPPPVTVYDELLTKYW